MQFYQMAAFTNGAEERYNDFFKTAGKLSTEEMEDRELQNVDRFVRYNFFNGRIDGPGKGWINLPYNVVISNVPGPREALYFAGCKLDNYIPVSTIADDMGLNITVHSYLDRLDFGLIADRELVPDLWDLVDLHIGEIGRLIEATGAEWFEKQEAPSMRRGTPGLPGTDRSAKTAAGKKALAKTSRAKTTPRAKKPAAKKSAAKKSAAKSSAVK